MSYPEQPVKNQRMDTTRIQTGVFFAVAAIFLPVLYLPLSLLSEDKITSGIWDGSFLPILTFLLAITNTCVWAGGVVRCITDIVREYSATGRFGLFLLLITPMIWIILALTVYNPVIVQTVNNLGIFFQGLNSLLG